jgi:hypothetical protein
MGYWGGSGLNSYRKSRRFFCPKRRIFAIFLQKALAIIGRTKRIYKKTLQNKYCPILSKKWLDKLTKYGDNDIYEQTCPI